MTAANACSPFQYEDVIPVTFPDDICFEILSFLNSEFIIKTCMMISKQWLSVVRNRVKLSLFINKKLDDDQVKSFIECKLLNNITSLYLEGRIVTISLHKSITLMTQLKVTIGLALKKPNV